MVDEAAGKTQDAFGSARRTVGNAIKDVGNAIKKWRPGFLGSKLISRGYKPRKGEQRCCIH